MMKKVLFALFAVTATSAQATVNDEEMQLLWGAWKNVHGKNYTTDDEDANRMGNFVENYNTIIAHNKAKNSTITLGLNKFSDLTLAEYKAQYASGYVPSSQPSESEGEGRRLRGTGEERSLSSLPSSVDWRTKGAVTPIKDQGSCGGCWSFSTTGALEGLHKIKSGTLLSFSEQQLIDCDKESSGCSSGSMSNAMAYSAEYGIELESAYPFKEKDTACTYSSAKAYKVNTGHTSVTRDSASALLSAIANQPVSVAIDASQSTFMHYKSGVITSGCSSVIDHGVLAVGYTTVNGVQAYIVKNSWGTGWGEAGYVYISTASANSGKGMCGILSEPVYPTV